MKNITLSFRFLAAWMLPLLGLSAQAQDAITVDGTSVSVVSTQTVTVDVVEQTAYSGDTVQFSVDEVVNALGVDSIGAANQYIVNVTTNEAVENTSDGWRDSAGDLASWGTEGGVCVKIDDPASGWVDYIGCYDEAWEAGDTYTAIWAFVANDKAALVKVVITFVDNGIPDAPEAELDINNITVVGTAEGYVERYASDGYETTSVTVDATGMAAALGLEASDLALYFTNDVYVAYNDQTMFYKVDSLQLLTETDGWLQQTAMNYDGLAGDLTNEVCASYYSSACSYYIQNMVYDAETEQVTYDMGQMPSQLSVGDTLYADLYVMNGNLGYIIRHTTVIVEATSEGFDEMTQVGTADVGVEMYLYTNYETTTYSPDLETMAAALGCDTGSIGFKALAEGGGGFSTSTTANNGGYWFDADGYVTSWGSSAAMFIEPVTSGDLSALSVGQYPGGMAVGDAVTVPLYFTYESNYYLVNFTLTIVEKPVVTFDEMENAGTRTVNIQALLDEGYVWSSNGTISLNDIYTTLGTTSVTLYGDEVDDDGVTSKTDSYTMDPTPGFWLTAEGNVTSWGNGSVWGMTIGYETSDDDIIFNYMQMPDACEEGDTYTGTVYLVNLEGTKYLTVNMVYRIVSEIVESESVGEGSLNIPVYTEDQGKEFALTEIASLLQVTEDELAEGYTLHALSGNMSTVMPSSGLEFDLTGNSVAAGEGVIYLYFENGQVFAVANTEIPDDLNISTEVAFETNGYIYTLKVNLMSPSVYTGVSAVETATEDDGTAYDLTGRRAGKNFRGIAIKNGKKVVVK